MAKFASLIFDLDGTLSDSVPMILRSSQATHERLGLPWSEEAAKKYIGRPMYETAAEFAPGREEEYRTIFAEYNMLYIPKMIRPFAGVPSLLAKLQEADVPMCIVTSRLQWGADWSVEILNIKDYFTKVFGVEARLCGRRPGGYCLRQGGRYAGDWRGLGRWQQGGLAGSRRGLLRGGRECTGALAFVVVI